MSKVTFQQAIDKNYQFFIVEKHVPSVDISTGDCKYIDKERDTACAIGCLLPLPISQHLQDEFPNTTLEAIVKTNKELLEEYLENVEDEFWETLQWSHDDPALENKDQQYFMGEFLENLRELCKKYNQKHKEIIFANYVR